MTTDRDRLIWPDAAKGVCIFLVVLVHLTGKHYLETNWTIPGVVEAGWQGLSIVLTPIRMPLFFAISGYFVAKYIKKNWRDIIRPRIVSTYYLYLVWFLIHTVIFSTVLTLSASRPEGAGQFLLGLVFGYTSLWYLYALPVYFILIKLLAKRPWTTLIAASLLSVIARTDLLPSIGNSPSLLGNFVFFAAAAYLPNWIIRIAEQASNKRAGLTLALFLTLSTALAATNSVTQEPGIIFELAIGFLEFGTNIIAIYAGITFFSWLSQATPCLARPLAKLGQRTLAVYVLHLPLIAVISLLFASARPPLLVVTLYPVLASILLVALCIGIYRLLTWGGAGWLFALPTFRPSPDIPDSPEASQQPRSTQPPSRQSSE